MLFISISSTESRSSLSNLESELVSELKLPVHSGPRDATRRFIPGPLDAVKSEGDLIAASNSGINYGLCSRAMQLDANLALCAAKQDIRFGKQESKRILESVVGPGDGNLPTDDACRL